QQVAPRPEDVEVIAGMVGVVASLGDNRPVGLFGAAVDVPADAGPFDRVLALSGRTPTWVSPAQQAP
ncbi:MAG: TIGR03086 family protein, partial [Jatrophihabitans endophyticus]